MITKKEKLTIGLIGSVLLYVCSMVDGKIFTFIARDDQMVDCKVKNITFTLKRNQCKSIITKVYPFTYLDYITR